jgi:hypothetical protein
MGKKSPRLLNGDGDEMSLPGGKQTLAIFQTKGMIWSTLTMKMVRIPKPILQDQPCKKLHLRGTKSS